MTGHSIPQASDMPAFDLRIDELMLHGFKAADRYAIENAIERELARLFSAGDVSPVLLDCESEQGGLHIHRLNAGSFDVPHDAPPDAVGVQVARAIHRGLGGATQSTQPESRSASETTEMGGAGR